jgi:hypothetical protein
MSPLNFRSSKVFRDGIVDRVEVSMVNPYNRGRHDQWTQPPDQLGQDVQGFLEMGREGPSREHEFMSVDIRGTS